MMAARVAVLVNAIMTIAAVIIIVIVVAVEAAIGGTPMPMTTTAPGRGCLGRRSATMARHAAIVMNDGKMGVVASNHATIEIEMIRSTGE